MVMALVHALYGAYAVMVAIGLFGGFFVVPLNALLQERGHESVGAGSALAVQNFSENLVMLLFVEVYSLVSAAGVAVAPTVTGFGLVMFVAVVGLVALRLRRPAAAAPLRA
jgi:LPLT family lysophospholipid transporter-like MFS transporter